MTGVEQTKTLAENIRHNRAVIVAGNHAIDSLERTLTEIDSNIAELLVNPGPRHPDLPGLILDLFRVAA